MYHWATDCMHIVCSLWEDKDWAIIESETCFQTWWIGECGNWAMAWYSLSVGSCVGFRVTGTCWQVNESQPGQNEDISPPSGAHMITFGRRVFFILKGLIHARMKIFFLSLMSFQNAWHFFFCGKQMKIKWNITYNLFSMNIEVTFLFLFCRCP